MLHLAAIHSSSFEPSLKCWLALLIGNFDSALILYAFYDNAELSQIETATAMSVCSCQIKFSELLPLSHMHPGGS